MQDGDDHEGWTEEAAGHAGAQQADVLITVLYSFIGAAACGPKVCKKRNLKAIKAV